MRWPLVQFLFLSLLSIVVFLSPHSPRYAQANPSPPERFSSPQANSACSPSQAWEDLALSRAFLQREDLEEAERLARQALRCDPTLARAYGVLGEIAYAQEEFGPALDWLRTAEIFSQRTAEHLRWLEFRERVQKEWDIEAYFSTRQSPHFLIKFDPQIHEAFIEELLEELEWSHLFLREHLGFSPRRPITVVLYDFRPFALISQGPPWSAALYDGKIRIPLPASLKRSSAFSDWARADAIRRSILHEASHAFLYHGFSHPLPPWVEEGFAQFLSAEMHAADWVKLNEDLQSGAFPGLNHGERDFITPSRPQAQRAYLQAFATISFLFSRAGWEELRKFLIELGTGESLNRTLNKIYGLAPEELAVQTDQYILQNDPLQGE